ncbi:MAG: L-histidine N(alpha)-methyltransferase [Candidatus Saccharibacteria bacterium]
MKYFKNSELARLYNVSEKTVRNWVKSAQAEKSDLEFYVDEKGKAYIADTTKNALAIQALVQEGKKYVNSRTHKIVQPTDEFYSLYSKGQIIDIIGHLEKYNEFPFQYCHVGYGADLCEAYYKRLWGEGIFNAQSFFVDVVLQNMDYLQDLMKDFDKVNIVDIGGRTGLPIREILREVNSRDWLNKYINIDISQDMIAKNKNNIHEWFQGNIEVEAYVRDISRDGFNEILFDNSSNDNARVANLVFFVGGTLYNLLRPDYVLRNIQQSLGKDDIFITSTKLDTSKSRNYFDFSPSFQNQLLDPKRKVAVDLLGIDESFYEVEQLYNEISNSRFIQIRLKFDISIDFETSGVSRRVGFKKGQCVILLRCWHRTEREAIEEAKENGFKVLQSTMTPDEEGLTIVMRPDID